MAWAWAGAGRRLTVVLALAVAGVAAATAPAWAANSPHGHDISHPQCDKQPPADSAFGIVGINHGLPFSANPCLQDQYRWAAGRPSGRLIHNGIGGGFSRLNIIREGHLHV